MIKLKTNKKFTRELKTRFTYKKNKDWYSNIIN